MDVLYVPTWLSQIEHLWESPKVNRFFERSAHLGRLIMFDRRGSGMSDPIVGAPTLEEQMDDVNAVLDAAGGCEDVVLLAALEGGPMACLYAATHPHRVRALVLYSAWARVVQSEDIPWANPPEERERLMEFLAETWGTGARLDGLAPSEADDPEFRAWYAKLERLAASPNQIRILQKLIGEYDVRSVLPSIRVPTLVMHRRDDSLIDPRHSQYIAERIPGAKLVMLEGLRQPDGGRRQRRHHRRDRGVPRRGPPGARSRPHAGHRDVHGHRRLDPARVRDGRSPLARAAGEARRARAPQAGLLERAGDQDDGRRLPGHVRRPGPGDPVREGDRLRSQLARRRHSRRPAHGGVRGARRRRGRHGGAHRRARRLHGGPRRGTRLQHGEGPRGRLGDRLLRPRRARAQGRAGRVARLRVV